jgi:ATP-dependent 26S proteasome regulatory subunit
MFAIRDDREYVVQEDFMKVSYQTVFLSFFLYNSRF